jgi:hypothetical protein
MPLETEVVPPHGVRVPPTVRAQPAAPLPDARTSAAKPALSAKVTLPARRPPVATTSESIHRDPPPPRAAPVDPNRQALEEMRRLREDPDARRAFYDHLHRTVEQVRAGAPPTRQP